MRRLSGLVLQLSFIGVLMLNFQSLPTHPLTIGDARTAKPSSGFKPLGGKTPAKKATCVRPSASGLSIGEIACFGWWDFSNYSGNGRNACTVIDPEKGGSTVKALGCQVATKVCSSGVAVATRVVQTFEPWHDDEDGAELASPEDLALISEALKDNPSGAQRNLITFWVYTCQDVNAAANTEVLPAYVANSSFRDTH